MALTKGHLRFKEKIEANPLYTVETQPHLLHRGLKVYCKVHLPAGAKGRKVGWRTAWNYGTTLGKCDVCGWPRI